MNAGPLTPQKILGAKNWNISNGAYSSELLTQERKWISAHLKMAIEPEENGLQEVCLTLTFDLWM